MPITVHGRFIYLWKGFDHVIKFKVISVSPNITFSSIMTDDCGDNFKPNGFVTVDGNLPTMLRSNTINATDQSHDSYLYTIDSTTRIIPQTYWPALPHYAFMVSSKGVEIPVGSVAYSLAAGGTVTGFLLPEMIAGKTTFVAALWDWL